MSEQNHFAGQIYSAIVERCEAWDVTPPNVVQEWTCPDVPVEVTTNGLVAFGFGSADVNGFYVQDPTAPSFWLKYGDDDSEWWVDLALWFWDDGDPETPDTAWIDDWDDSIIYYSGVPSNGVTGVGTAYEGAEPIGGIYPYEWTFDVPAWTNVTTTNAIGPFTYQDSDDVTRTAYPLVTRAFLAAMDSKIATLAGYTVATNEADPDGSFDSWFTNTYHTFAGDPPVVDSTNLLLTLPVNSMAGLGDRLGIGYVTNRTGYSFDPETNAIDFVTGGDFYWTRQPETTQTVVLADHISRGPTNDWRHRDLGTFDRKFYSAELPKLRFLSYTNDGLSGDVELIGWIIDQEDQSLVFTSETVTVTGDMMETNALGLYEGTTNLSLTWYDLEGTNKSWLNLPGIIAPTNPAGMTGDVITVAWDGPVGLFGDQPFRLYAQDVDERVAALKAMNWTHKTAGIVRPGDSPWSDIPEVYAMKTNSGTVSAWGYWGGSSNPVTSYWYPPPGSPWHWERDQIGASWETADEPSGYDSAYSETDTVGDSPDPWNGDDEVWFEPTFEDIEFTRWKYVNDPWSYTFDVVAKATFVSRPDSGSADPWVTFHEVTGYYDIIVQDQFTDIGDTLTATNRVMCDDPDDLKVKVLATTDSGEGEAEIKVEILSCEYVGADVYGLAINWPIGFMFNEDGVTNFDKTVDLYAVGKYTTWTWDPMSLEPWRMYPTGVLKSWDYSSASLNQLYELNPDYLATNDPPHVWTVPDAQTDLESLTHSNMTRLVSLDRGTNSWVAWDWGMHTNGPFAGEWDIGDTSKGFAIRSPKAVVKWTDFEFK